MRAAPQPAAAAGARATALTLSVAVSYCLTGGSLQYGQSEYVMSNNHLLVNNLKQLFTIS